MNSSKVINVVNVNEVPIEVTIKTQVSEWDVEQVEEVYFAHMQFDEVIDPQDPKKTIRKANIKPESGGKVIRQRNDKLMETFITSWTADGAPTPENLKKELDRKNYGKILEEIEKIYAPNELTEEKKIALQKKQSEPSAVV